ncbi:hypothetical protein GCM10022243_48660 [Saccharothrix violaceirubra]|uniref:ADP-ribose pyrophosphatase YjhB (NUDIX family) n=1 Tax=Saccharothrix violaceirubra TaxID=413306 RepID=A0A7W7T0J4_9PSEU|nr:NUDIX domain-containing protein [Saccharothrix violaceirubra]MBB4963792.1 ADP-ribose pyrophosphatase YjhB (NUDIX family) [Saccharothrix violaceirubra]
MLPGTSTPHNPDRPDRRHPALTADAVVLHRVGHDWWVLTVARGKDPYQGQPALPGGHVHPDETPLAAAIRELAEETGIVVPGRWHHVGGYADPGRDPRGDYATLAYVTVATFLPVPVAGDDAATAEWRRVDDGLYDRLGFDHARIVRDAIKTAKRLAAPVLAPVSAENTDRYEQARRLSGSNDPVVITRLADWLSTPQTGDDR